MLLSEDKLRYERTWPAVGFSSLKEVFAGLPLQPRFVERTLRRSIEDVYNHVADLSLHPGFLPPDQIREWRVQTEPPWGHGTVVEFEWRWASSVWKSYRS